LKFKLDAVEFAEMQSNEKAARMFQVTSLCRKTIKLRYQLPVGPLYG